MTLFTSLKQSALSFAHYHTHSMPGIVDGSGPSYVSSHSADVILSDIRPIKLKAEALRSINVLLDEFLYKILATACSLTTDRLRASLLSQLPTNLGKEALLEAEVELRAYWERTGPADATLLPLEDDSETFHLQWAFELLRLKCEAYSTLNELDEDPVAEGRIHETLGLTNGPALLKSTLVAPAALYLTAILEAICEHILSNVGRVASRDGSRTMATVQDLFVALCEDDSIYGLFRSMKVYEQIENLSKTPKPHRSKSFTRSDKHPHSRTSSPHQDLPNIKENSGPVRSRLSSEATMMAITSPPASGSRSSFERPRSMKMFTSSRSSNERDRDSQNGHKKTESVLSENTKQTIAAAYQEEPSHYEDSALQEFDDLMRSNSTVKMSLTPVRLKTMEAYKQEKDQRENKRLAPLVYKPETDTSSPPSRTNNRLPALRHVDSIVEDEEETSPSKPQSQLAGRTRQASVSAPPSIPLASAAVTRIRSISTSGSGPRSLLKKSTRNTASPVSYSPPPPVPPTMPVQQRRPPIPNHNGFPPRTRKVQGNRESLDLDEIMAGSDGEDIPPPVVTRKPVTPKRGTKPPVSTRTQDLIDFLAEGPPSKPLVSKASREMIDFLAEGPPDYNPSTFSSDSTKSKGSGRLHRIMSKLNMGSSDKSRVHDDLSRSSSRVPPTPTRPTVYPKGGGMSSLANRPIPPRPRPISPPYSPSRGSLEDPNPPSPSSQEASVSRKALATRETLSSDTQPSLTPSNHSKSDISHPSPNPPPLPPINKHLINNAEPRHDISRNVLVDPTSTTDSPTVNLDKAEPKHSIARKPVPSMLVTKTSPVVENDIVENDIRDMHRLISKATNADECRLILDMLLAKSGMSLEPKEFDVPYPSPSPSDTYSQAVPSDTVLEHSLVELFLSGDQLPDLVPRKHRSKTSATDLMAVVPPRGSSRGVAEVPP
ncbi:hypothetical protein BD779DRAFT_1492950 [Infundibulicybe gibba]|nr:hypothetical protein BD779DRAFT_1492950 [Infundibulicybe gibba]